MKVLSPLYVLPLPRELQLHTRGFLEHPMTEIRYYRAAIVTKMLMHRAQQTAEQLEWCHPDKSKGMFCFEAMDEIRQYIEKNVSDVCGACRFYQKHRIRFFPRCVDRFHFPFSLRQKLMEKLK